MPRAGQWCDRIAHPRRRTKEMTAGPNQLLTQELRSVPSRSVAINRGRACLRLYHARAHHDAHDLLHGATVYYKRRYATVRRLVCHGTSLRAGGRLPFWLRPGARSGCFPDSFCGACTPACRAHSARDCRHGRGLTPESYLAPDAHGLHTVDIAPTVADWLHLEIRAPSIPAPTGIEPIAAGAGLRDKLPPKTIPHFTFGPACTS